MQLHTAVLTAIVSTLLLSCATARAVDLVEVEKKLTTTGIEGEIHGASADNSLFVFTVRAPDNFFDFVELSLIPDEVPVQRALEKLNRHDRVRIKGFFLPNKSPQKHVAVQSLEMVKKYESPVPAPSAYEHEARIPDELLNQASATFLVHAVHADGHILVVEYKDVVLPIWVKNGDLSKDLFRGDVVKLGFTIQKHPGEPVHLKLNETETGSVRVIESIRKKHGTKGTMEGALVLFPKSPEIKFNVFALLEDLPGGLKRQYTLVNFESPEAFAKLREKLQTAWDRHPKDFFNGRNKLVSRAVRVKATGTFNEIDPNQANPQILVTGPEAVEILE
jgi:hypothetical protein